MRLTQHLKDPQLWVAMALAPLFWLVLWQLGYAHFELADKNPWRLFLPALIYPVLEEMVFRGLIQQELYRSSWGKRRAFFLSNANIAGSLMFALSHLIYHPPMRALCVFFPSLIFGYFRDRYGSLAPSIALHILYNSGYLLLFSGCC